MEQTEKKKSWKEEMHEWAGEFNVEVKKLAHREGISIDVGFSGAYNMGRFGHQETSFFEVIGDACGAGAGVYGMTSKRKRVVVKSYGTDAAKGKDAYAAAVETKALKLIRHFERELAVLDTQKKADVEKKNDFVGKFGTEEVVKEGYMYHLSYNGFSITLNSEKVLGRVKINWDNKIIVTEGMVEQLKEIFGAK